MRLCKHFFYLSGGLSFNFLYFAFWEEGMMLQLKLCVCTSLSSHSWYIGSGLWKPSDSFVVCFCEPDDAQHWMSLPAFWSNWPIKHPINLFPLQFAYRKQRTVHLQGASNINCMQHCCFYIDVVVFHNQSPLITMIKWTSHFQNWNLFH